MGDNSRRFGLVEQKALLPDWIDGPFSRGGTARGPEHCMVSVYREMLVALKEMVRTGGRKHEVWERARAAIAKAEGL